MNDLILQVKDLRTYFHVKEGVIKAVDGVSYHVNRGETLGLVGESGCGKSVSALSILKLLDQPPARIHSGEILFEKKNLLNLEEKQMREVRGGSISMIFQEPMTSLNPVLSIGCEGHVLKENRVYEERPFQKQQRTSITATSPAALALS